MTQDEVVEMTLQAGWTGIYSKCVSPTERQHLTVPVTIEQIEAFANLVAAKEREACAKVLDEMAKEAEAEQEPSGYIDYYRRKATEIRARGEQA